MPPRSRGLPTDPNELAPAGSERTRSGAHKEDRLPPGRRNQPTAKPVNPDQPEVTTKARGALGRLAKIAGDELAPDAEPVQDVTDRVAAALEATDGLAEEFYGEDVQAAAEARRGVYADPGGALAAANEALMYALRLRIAGEGDFGTWEEFDVLAEQALLLSAPSDPMESVSDVTRFLWGDTGLMRMPEKITDGEDVADVLNLGARVEEGG